MGKRRRLLDEYQFPGYRQRVDIQGVFGDPRARVIKLERVQKNGFWLLWCGLAELLRQESTADMGSVMQGCPDLSGGGGSPRMLPEVWKSEARETALISQQSFFPRFSCLGVYPSQERS